MKIKQGEPMLKGRWRHHERQCTFEGEPLRRRKENCLIDASKKRKEEDNNQESS